MWRSLCTGFLRPKYFTNATGILWSHFVFIYSICNYVMYRWGIDMKTLYKISITLGTHGGFLFLEPFVVSGLRGFKKKTFFLSECYGQPLLFTSSLNKVRLKMIHCLFCLEEKLWCGGASPAGSKKNLIFHQLWSRKFKKQQSTSGGKKTQHQRAASAAERERASDQ